MAGFQAVIRTRSHGGQYWKSYWTLLPGTFKLLELTCSRTKTRRFIPHRCPLVFNILGGVDVLPPYVRCWCISIRWKLNLYVTNKIQLNSNDELICISVMLFLLILLVWQLSIHECIWVMVVFIISLTIVVMSAFELRLSSLLVWQVNIYARGFLRSSEHLLWSFTEKESNASSTWRSNLSHRHVDIKILSFFLSFFLSFLVDYMVQ